MDLGDQNCDGLKPLPLGEVEKIQLLSSAFQLAIQECEEAVKLVYF